MNKGLKQQIVRIVLGAAITVSALSPLVAASPVVAAAAPSATPGQPHVFPSKGSTAAAALNAAQSAGVGNLAYGGGPVMHSSTTYTIFWQPNGYHFDQTGTAAADAQYETLVQSYFKNAGGTSFYNILTQYPGSTTSVLNSSNLGGSYVDTIGFPNGRGPIGIPLTDLDIQGEVAHVMAIKSWPAGPGNMFVVYTPVNAYSCATGVGCSFSSYCAYHSYFGPSAAPTIYANMPDPATNFGACGTGTSPNGDSAADSVINVTSHEHFEAVSDPELNAWRDAGGYEIGDKCAWTFGPISKTGADVVLNSGGQYIVQEEWNNAGANCALAFGRAATFQRPAAVSWGPPRIDLGTLGSDGTIADNWFDGSTWHLGPLGNPGVALTSGPAISTWKQNNRLDVFALDGTGKLWDRVFDGTAWIPWQVFPWTGFTGSPAAVSWGPGRIDAVLRGSDGNIYDAWFGGGNWNLGALGNPGVSLNSSPAVSSWGVGRLDVFAVDLNGRLWDKWIDGAAWQPWGMFPWVGFTGDPAAVSWGPGRIDVVVRGTDGNVYQAWFDGAWHLGNLGTPGVTLASSPAVSSWGPNRLDVFVMDSNGTMWHKWIDGSTWQPWETAALS